MNPEEIKNCKMPIAQIEDRTVYMLGQIVLWLSEIAYQLAVMNENQKEPAHAPQKEA